MKKATYVMVVLAVLFSFGFANADTVINVHGHWGTLKEIQDHKGDLAALNQSFAGKNVTIIDLNYSNGTLTDKNPFAYVDPIGTAIAACNDTNIVIVAHSMAPPVVVLAVNKRNLSYKIAGMVSLGGMWGGVPTGTYWLLNESFKDFNTESEFVITTGPDSEFIRKAAMTKTNYSIVDVHGWVEMAFGVGGISYTSIFVPRPGDRVINNVWAFHPDMYQNPDVENVIVEESMKMFTAHRARQA